MFYLIRTFGKLSSAGSQVSHAMASCVSHGVKIHHLIFEKKRKNVKCKSKLGIKNIGLSIKRRSCGKFRLYSYVIQIDSKATHYSEIIIIISLKSYQTFYVMIGLRFYINNITKIKSRMELKK